MSDSAETVIEEELPAPPFQHGPRADFLCEVCHQAGKMPEPVTLPTLARKCPICGKAKFFRRIWDGPGSPGIIAGDRHAKSRFTATMGRENDHGSKDAVAAEWDRQQGARRSAVEARSKGLGPQVVPASSLSQFGLGLPSGKAHAVPMHASPVLGAVGGPAPGHGSRQGGGKIVKGADGRLRGTLER